MKKLYINESPEVVFTPDFAIPETNVFETGDFADYASYADLDSASEEMCADNACCECGDIYAQLEGLGMLFSLAANDVHTVHINACGANFKELHECADDLYEILGGYSDHALEMSCESGRYIKNINEAVADIDYTNHACSGVSFDINTGTQVLVEILNDVICSISGIYDCADTDIQSVFDEWLRELTSKANYFLKRVQECGICHESIMSASVRNKRKSKKTACEHLDKLKLGQSYPMFCQVEDHIDDYNCDTTTLKKGDYIIRDFQFGHLPNGGNKGYIPYKVVDIEYDRDEDTQGFWDARKRLHLYDGSEDTYINCYDERFNGMFHKLYRKSVVEDD